MTELLVRAGLRLAPAMAAMALIVSVGSARLSSPYESTPATIVPAEELLLDDHQLSTALLLAAIHGESIER